MHATKGNQVYLVLVFDRAQKVQACALGTKLIQEQITRHILTNRGEDFFSANQVREETKRD